MLQKIDGALELAAPAGVDDLAAAFIDQHQRARLHDRIHRPVLRTDERVAMVLQIQRIQQARAAVCPSGGWRGSDRWFCVDPPPDRSPGAPELRHACRGPGQQVRLLQLDAGGVGGQHRQIDSDTTPGLPPSPAGRWRTANTGGRWWEPSPCSQYRKAGSGRWQTRRSRRRSAIWMLACSTSRYRRFSRSRARLSFCPASSML